MTHPASAPPAPPAATRRSGRGIAAGLALAVAAGVVGYGLFTVSPAPAVGALTPPPMDEGITGHDFTNATLQPFGSPDPVTLVDGVALNPGMEEIGVGYHIAQGPVFADIDADADLDAAMLMMWSPAAGATTYSLYVWTWDDGAVAQVPRQLDPGYRGLLTDLAATGTAFTVARTMHADLSGHEQTDTVTVGLSGEDLVLTDPMSAVAPCLTDPAGPPGAAVAENVPPLTAPHAEAAPADVPRDAAVTTVESDYDGDGWVVAAIRSGDVVHACGWVPIAAVGN
ncbi:hypothetical protein LX16_2754 [Stackebrandtia albiflava]|uniref:Uncharacterized protein n=1 Tax=Stackebrandtia albiflava TaxID=406432 RepID=A0A562V285_9ACTN|nr:hypothetical protein [Stackebrandtia albiflava]TWJ12009.1 hypothetical protein LX16_2754 [Stackebrandtia albiflava]